MTLDTLPEGKLAEGNSQYKRVYSDWKPTVDKTDVVGTMEAIAGKTYKTTSCFYIIIKQSKNQQSK